MKNKHLEELKDNNLEHVDIKNIKPLSKKEIQMLKKANMKVVPEDTYIDNGTIITKTDEGVKEIPNVIDKTGDSWVSNTLGEIETLAQKLERENAERIIEEEAKEAKKVLDEAASVIVYLKDVTKAESYSREVKMQEEHEKKKKQQMLLIMFLGVLLIIGLLGGIKGVDNSFTLNSISAKDVTSIWGNNNEVVNSSEISTKN